MTTEIKKRRKSVELRAVDNITRVPFNELPEAKQQAWHDFNMGLLNQQEITPDIAGMK